MTNKKTDQEGRMAVLEHLIVETDIESFYEYGINNDWQKFDELKEEIIQYRLDNVPRTKQARTKQNITNAMVTAKTLDGTPLIASLVSDEECQFLQEAMIERNPSLVLAAYSRIREKLFTNHRFAYRESTASAIAARALLNTEFEIEPSSPSSANEFFQNKFDIAIENDDQQEINALKRFALDVSNNSNIKFTIPYF